METERENKQIVATFSTTRTFGDKRKWGGGDERGKEQWMDNVQILGMTTECLKMSDVLLLS